jgi:hypothetical protein
MKSTKAAVAADRHLTPRKTPPLNPAKQPHRPSRKLLTKRPVASLTDVAAGTDLSLFLAARIFQQRARTAALAVYR